MAGAFALDDAQTYLREQRLDGWLLADFQQNNPIFWQVVGSRRHTTRRAFLFVPPDGEPRFLLHMIDVERLSDLGWPTDVYLSRADQEVGLRTLLQNRKRVAMEYSPSCALPVVSRVDAGTIEQIRALGVTVVSSGDVIQYAVSRWSPEQIRTHEAAAQSVVTVAKDAFGFISDHLEVGVDELAVGDFIRKRFAELDLVAEGGPDVAANAHSSDPHYDPTPALSRRIARGDWVLIDLWAKQNLAGSIYGDTTWVGFVGESPGPLYLRVFDSVKRARDEAIDLLQTSWMQGKELEGWEVDARARRSIEGDGYGRFFTHRLGHSLGEAIHSNGVNLDGFETHDTRKIIPGVGFSVEPGIYLPEFGVRLEVDVYVDPQRGPRVTTPAQVDIIRI